MDEIRNGREPRRRSAIAIAAAGVGVGIILGAAGIAGAASDPPKAPSGTTTAPAPAEKPGRPGHAHRGGPMGMRGLGAALHGELVVPNGSGGYKTVQVQRGAVTSVSATSLTVKSADGFTRTYALDAKTVVNGGRAKVASLKTGAKVGVLADVSGSTLTATHVRDLTQLREMRKDRRPGAPGKPATPSDYGAGSEVANA